MQSKLTLLLALFMLIATGCATSSGGLGSAASCPGPQFGIVTDENLQVVQTLPESAAETAGVQAGDKLVSLAYISGTPSFNCNDVVYLDANGSPLASPAGIGIPAQPQLPDFPAEPVPFTNREAIREFMISGLVLKLTVVRDGQAVDLTITPRLPGEQRPSPENSSPLSTPTPIPAGYDYF